MRILSVLRDLDKGGTQRVAQNFAEAYQTLGHDSRVLATQAGGVRHDELASRGIHVWLRTGPETMAAIREWQPDLVHLHSHGPTASEVRVILDCCRQATVIETNVFSRRSPWVDAVHVSFQLSEWCRWRYAQRAGPMARSAVLPNAVNVGGFRRSLPESISRFRAEHGVAPGDFLIGRIGQANDSKWSPMLVDTFEQVRDGGIPAKLVVVNAPPSILDRCRASRHAAATIVMDQVIGDEALSTVYSAIDLFVHVADGGESFGLVLAESMLCETPAVTLATPWNDNSQGEVVGQGVGGFVATTPGGFRRAVEVLAREPDLRSKLGRQGRQRVLERFDALALARQALDYATTPARRESPPPDRRAILSLYRDAFDKPSRLTCLAIGRFPRLEITRYTTGYQPWSRLLARCATFVGRSCGVLKRP